MAVDAYRLVIGDKNTSSWSLRPWLALKQAGIAFEEVRINLRAPDMKQRILAHSPAGKVPVLWAGDLMIWDSLWPPEAHVRAVARAASAEMHSGFQALREHCPMKLLATEPKAEHIEPVVTNIRRVVTLWKDCRQKFGGRGPFLFSDFSIADAMYAPVASRLRTYVADLREFGDDGTAASYVDTLFALPAMRDWAEGARQETAEA
jgi:glutathione S-transferase